MRWPWQEGLLGFPQIQALTVALFLSLPALQALRRDDSPSPINIIVQEIFNERAAELRSSAGSEPVSL